MQYAALLICCKKRNEAQATAPGFLASTFDMVDLFKLQDRPQFRWKPAFQASKIKDRYFFLFRIDVVISTT